MKDFFKNNKKRILKILAVIAIIMIAATVWYEIPVTEQICARHRSSFLLLWQKSVAAYKDDRQGKA